ncbi:AraC-like transcriptional regulator QhpR [Polymorphum gilvum]|uniref:Transcriptional regulator, AraC family protein n=1 Tax=Polymorphum gilvum (strain LMG 25793 / CGMCC 1.9160 / SL003B-26A1) TaxID=991905 RepID=F2J2K1_POLGS|nr:AraC family transcriptional regulator [Polymorphum gilvum]ADZ70915.1 Transcriptional regulator, AraC family protein [Polymorphum gilvum SL003B-26A1]
MPTGATIVSGALAGLQHVLADRGLEPADLGRQSGVPAGAWSNARTQIPLTSFVALYEQGADRLALPGLGWQSGPLLDLADLGDLGTAILSAPTVGQALKTFVRFIGFVQSETDMRLEVEDGVAMLSYRILNPDIWPRRQDAEFTLSVLAALIRRGAGPDWSPDLVCFEHAAARPARHWREAVGAPCLFDCETNWMSFSDTLLDCPMAREDAGLHRSALDALTHRLVASTRARSLSGRIRMAIYAGLGQGTVDQETIARDLGLSRRSLHRHLSEEGTRFSALLEDCRFRVARHALADTAHPLTQIALELNYSDQTAFERAFKRHTGLTPRQYRKAFGRPPHS